MKKIILYSILLGAVLLLPLDGTDVGKLLPVEVISIYKDADNITVATDAGGIGVGTTVQEAIADMKATTAGNVFLDTADYLLIRDLSNKEAETLKGILKPSMRICEMDGSINPEETPEYLRIHRPEQRLREWTGTNSTQLLTIEDGKLILEFLEKR